MRRVIDEETARFESGLTVLASVGSTAPFVGLFGTVWGVYHALINIGMSGQGTLDKVAGPVGEALIMTALGLAVAIPAVLAYNALRALEPRGARAARRVRARSVRVPHHRLARRTTSAPSCAARSRPRGGAGSADMAFGGFHRSGTDRADGGDQHDPADRRHAGAARDLHHHRAAAHARGEDRPAQGGEPAQSHQARQHPARHPGRRRASTGTARPWTTRCWRERMAAAASSIRSPKCTSAPTRRRSTRSSPKSWRLRRASGLVRIGFVSDPQRNGRRK